MNDVLKGILIGVVSILIASGIIYVITKQFVWNAAPPLWVWLAITIVLAVLVYVTMWDVRKYPVLTILSEFTEGNIFGKTNKGKKRLYNAFGYEATDIRTKNPLSEMKNEHTSGHEIPEDTINLFV